MLVAVKTSFDAAHVLTGYKGKCGNLHGHTYSVVVEVESRGDTDEMGMVVDYNELKPVVKEIVDEYDHAFLCGSCDSDELRLVLIELGYKIKNIRGYSSTENIAIQLITELIKYVVVHDTKWVPYCVRVSETESTYAEVYSSEIRLEGLINEY